MSCVDWLLHLEGVMSCVSWELCLEGVVSCVGRQLGIEDIRVGSERREVWLFGEGRV